MRDFILSDGETLFRAALNQKGHLVLSEARGEQITAQNVIFPHPCLRFSCDIDTCGTVHAAAVTKNTLTYITYSKGKSSTTHLMHLPEKFSVTSVMINAEKDIRLHYSVKSAEGRAIIEYTRSGEEWKGRNLLTCPEDAELLCLKKGTEECYVFRNGIVNPYSGAEIFFCRAKPDFTQVVRDGIVFVSGETVYKNGEEIALGEAVYALDGERILISENGKLKEMICSPSLRPSGEASFPRGAKEYVFCSPSNNKRIIISPPFPYIRTEPQKTSGAGIMQEVYMQQRAIFALQAEVKELKNRLRRLEDRQENRR